jgi:hypothetical protein
MPMPETVRAYGAVQMALNLTYKHLAQLPKFGSDVLFVFLLSLSTMHSVKTGLFALFATTAVAAPEPIRNRAAAPAGKNVQWVGHSFHWFLPEPVAKLAAEAGIKGHKNINVDRIGASLPCQHWNKGGTTNTVKENLKAGKADVLTLATREPAPDECIPKFVKLAVSYHCPL